MFRTVLTPIPARVLSALVALSLSGAPAFGHMLVRAGHAAPHRCQCPAGHHDCRCPVCRGAGHGAHDGRRAAIAELPPCHRAKALAALADEEAQEERDARSSAPSLRSGCDPREDRLPTSASQEAFVIPGRWALATDGRLTRRSAPAGAEFERARVPELPPPRRG